MCALYTAFSSLAVHLHLVVLKCSMLLPDCTATVALVPGSTARPEPVFRRNIRNIRNICLMQWVSAMFLVSVFVLTVVLSLMSLGGFTIHGVADGLLCLFSSRLL